jgi:TonB-linked SusC/RagA family outer membrane protein
MKENHEPLKKYGSIRLLLLFLFITFFITAQSQTITGTVVDKENQPVNGASVTVKGTKIATATNSAGNFSIKAGSSDILVFSFIGFVTLEIPVNDRNTISVTMIPTEGSMDAVIVTALGIRREAKKLGYATETVRLNEIQQNRTSNFMTALEGKIAGLDISPPAAGAGASNKIRLRGQAAFAGANNSPLIVINGLPMDQGARGANGTGNQTDLGDNLQMINPDDIESMTVLKGAVAAAIYGSRAANGAIIITTKSGNKNSGMGIEYTLNYASDNVIDLTDFQYEFGQGTGGVRPATAGIATSNGQFGFGARYDGVPTPQFDGVSRPYLPHKNRIKEFFRTGSTFTNTIALSGGNDKGSYRSSYSMQEGKGIVPNNTYRKNIFNLGLNYNMSEKLSVQINANYTNEQNNNPPFVGSQGPGVTNFLYRISPSIGLDALEAAAADANGNETRTTNFNTTLINPYYILPRQFTRSKRDRLLGTVTVRYEFFKWLYLQGRANMDFGTTFFDQNVPTGSGIVGNVSLNAAGTGYTGSYTVTSNTSRQMNLDFLLGGSHRFRDFSVDLSVGGNTYDVNGRNHNQAVNNFVARGLYTIDNGLAEGRTNSYTIYRERVNSLYAFADLGYKNLLFINLTGRNDWFSVLNPKNNNFFYPSASGSFIFSELLKNVSWLNYGKLRGGYSVVGSANGIGAFEGILTFGFDGTLFNGYTMATMPTLSPNSNLKPFSVAEKEVGIELKMFGSRVNLDVSVYDRDTKDQIVTVSNSTASGYLDTKMNYGALENKGIEVLLEVSPVKTRNFTWVSSFNTAYNQSKVKALSPGIMQSFVAQFNDGAELFGAVVNQVGLPLNQIWGKGYFRNSKGEIEVNNNGTLKASTGNMLFGSALPKYTGGWNNVFRYKSLSLLVHIDYKAGGKMLSGTALNGLRQGHSKASLVGRRPGETGVVFPAVYASGGANTTAVDPQSFYSAYRSLNIVEPFVYKSDFIKLRNITLSYDFSRLVSKNVKFVKGLLLAASCRNVLIIKKYVPDIDPESVQSSGDFRVGYEQSALPTARTYSINLNVKF